MKKSTILLFFVFIAILMSFPLNLFAADTTHMSLPEGAKARLGKGSINEIAYSPNGKHLAAAGSIGTWLYDMTTYQEVALFTGYDTGPVRSIAFSPDGNTLISGNADGTVWVWNTDTGEHIQTFGAAEWLWSVAFSPDGKTIASGGGHVEGLGPGIQLLDIETGEYLKAFGGPHDTLSVCFSPDGKTLASSGDKWDSNIRLSDVQTGELLKTLKKRTAFEDFAGRDVNSVVFSPDGNTIASGSSNGTIRLWNPHTGEFIKYLVGHTKAINSVVFSPNGDTLLSVGAEGFCLWEVNTGEYIEEIPIHAISAAFSPDGNTCAMASEMGIFVRNAHTFQILEILTRNTGSEDEFRGKDIGSIGSVAFSPDGNTIVSCGGNNIHLWDAHTNQLLKTLIGHTEPVNSVVFSPDGNTIASASTDRTIRLWNVNTQEHLKTLMAHAASVSSVVFSPDGNTIASSSSDRAIRLWNANTGELLKPLTGHIENVNTIAFSPDGNTIASGSGRLVYLGKVGEDSGTCVGQEIRLWNAHTGEHLKTLTGHTSVVNSVVFSPDGNTIVSGSGHWHGYEGIASTGEEIRLWNAHTGEHLKTLTGHKNVISSVVFSPDGNLIVSGDWYDDGYYRTGNWTGEIRVWDAHIGELLKTLKGHTGGVSSVAFSPDGKTLASGRTDGTILLWDFSELTKQEMQ